MTILIFGTGFLEELEFRYNFRNNINDSLHKRLGGINLGIIQL
jgi:hypothetical protein